jgi:hypothetical protein
MGPAGRFTPIRLSFWNDENFLALEKEKNIYKFAGIRKKKRHNFFSKLCRF